MHIGTKEVIEHARACGGVVTRTEAVALGLQASALAHLVDMGVLHRLKPGIFALAGARTDNTSIELIAACRSLGAVVSHESAAQIHGLDRWLHIKPSVSVVHRTTNRFPGIRVHQLTDLIDDHIQAIDEVPVTTPERTVIDLSAVLAEQRLERIVDQGLAAKKLNLEALSDMFDLLARKGKPGVRRMRSILLKRSPGLDAPTTELERRLLDVVRRAGLPEPQAQHTPPWLVPTNGRVDFAYPKHNLVIEGDSRRWHTLLNSFEIDRLRDNAAQLAGWRVLRFTWQEITENPERVVSTIRLALLS
ncbi:MAG TPA: DUF559 domain-containing protein [Acidimicrobiia bacterium]